MKKTMKQCLYGCLGLVTALGMSYVFAPMNAVASESSKLIYEDENGWVYDLSVYSTKGYSASLYCKDEDHEEDHEEGKDDLLVKSSVTIDGTEYCIERVSKVDYCSNIESISFDEGIRIIDAKGMADYHNAEIKVSFPKSIAGIEDGFVQDNKLRDPNYFTKTVEEDEEVTTTKTRWVPLWLENMAEENPGKVIYAGDVAIYIPEGAGSEIEFSENCTSIAQYAAYNNDVIEKVKISASIKKIGGAAFAYAKNLSDVDMSENTILTSLNWATFYKDTSLKEIQIPDSVMTLEANCFQMSGLTGTGLSKNSNIKLIGYYAYAGTDLKSLAGIENVEYVLPYAFASTLITEASIPEKLTNVNSYVFANCTELKKVSFAETCKVTYLGTGAFQGCTALTEFTLPDCVTEIASMAFNECTSLSVFNISDKSSLKKMGYKVFGYGDDISSGPSYDAKPMTFSSTVKGCPIVSIRIPDRVFAESENVKNSTYDYYRGGNSPYAMFAGSQIIKNIELIPTGEEFSGSIHVYFAAGSTLESISLTENIQWIAPFAFYDCNKLTSISFGKDSSKSKLDFIYYEAFANCESLETMILPDSTRGVVHKAFIGAGLKTFQVGKNSKLEGVGCETFGSGNKKCPLESLTLPEKVFSVKNLAETVNYFSSASHEGTGCSSIPAYLCDGFTTLKKVTILDNPEEEIDSALSYACFRGCTSLTSIEIPDDIDVIGGECFKDCTALEKVTIGENSSLRRICWKAFANTVIKSIYLPGEVFATSSVLNGEKVRYTSDASFGWFREGYLIMGNREIEELNEYPAMESIEIGDVKYSDEKIAISVGSFAYFTNLNYVKLSEDVNKLDVSAFDHCAKLEYIDGLENVQRYEYACLRNTALTSIYFDSNVDYIANSVIAMCPKLTSVTFRGNSLGCKGKSDNYYTSSTNLLLGNITGMHTAEDYHENDVIKTARQYRAKYPEETLVQKVTVLPDENGNHIFKENENGYKFSLLQYSYVRKLVVGEGIEEIGDRSCMLCANLSEVQLPSTLKRIGKFAFYNCIKVNVDLTSYEKLETIDERAFFIDNPTGAISIGNHLAPLDGGLSDLVIPETVKTVGAYAFFGQANAKNIKLTSGTEVGNGAFQFTNSVENMDIDTDLLKGLGNDATTLNGSNWNSIFWNERSDALKTIILGENAVASSEAYAAKAVSTGKISSDNEKETRYNALFYGLAASKVVLPKNMTTISGLMFMEMKNLNNLTIPADVDRIGTVAFMNCDSLTKMVLPKKVERIETQAFESCDNLRNITIPENVTYLGRAVFKDDAKLLDEMTLPKTVQTVEIEAFKNSSVEQLNVLGKDTIIKTPYELIYEKDEDGKLVCTNPLEDTVHFTGVTLKKKEVVEEEAEEVVEVEEEDRIENYVAVNEDTTICVPINAKATTYDGFMPTKIQLVTMNCEDAGYDHEFVDTLSKKATTDHSGSIQHKCSCGEYTRETIPQINPEVQVEEAPVCNGEFQTPVIKVVDKAGKVIAAENYEVSYDEENVTENTYKATITFGGVYDGTLEFSYEVKDAIKPTVTKKATIGENGKICEVCEGCGENHGEIKEIIAPATMSLEKTSFVYNGKQVETNVTVVDEEGEEIASENYEVAFDKNVKVGKHVATITFKGDNYEGTMEAEYVIVPAKTTVTAVENVAKGVKVTWKKSAGATKYQVYRVEGKKSTLITTVTGTTYTDTKAVNGTKYSYKVVAINGSYKASASAAKSIVYVARVTLSTLKNTAAGKATLTWKENKNATSYIVEYCTSNKFASGVKKVTVKKGTTSVVLSNLTKNKTYYVRVTAVKKVGTKNYSSAVSAVLSVKITK